MFRLRRKRWEKRKKRRRITAESRKVGGGRGAGLLDEAAFPRYNAGSRRRVGETFVVEEKRGR